MKATREFLEKLGVPNRDLYDLPTSEKRFPDGAQFRIEIPSVESPEMLRRVIENVDNLDITIHRISQGSGVILLTDKQIEEMVEICKSEKLELSLYVGPRATYDIGGEVKAAMGNTLGNRIRGADQLVYAIEGIKRGIQLGVRGFLVADEGLLWILDAMKKAGEIPKDVIFKISASIGYPNPASACVLERLGAGTFNIPTDLTLPQIAAIRKAINIPIDLYVSVPTHFGGFVRLFEVAEIVRVAAPVYLKFGIPLGPAVYPGGEHIRNILLGFADEEVRLAKICLEFLNKHYPEAKSSEKGGEGIAIPV